MKPRLSRDYEIPSCGISCGFPIVFTENNEKTIFAKNGFVVVVLGIEKEETSGTFKWPKSVYQLAR